MTTLEFLRQYRIAGYAWFDLIVSFIGIYFLAPLLTQLFLKFKIKIPRISWMFFTLPLSIIIHLLTKNITPMTRNFLDMNGHYVLKIFIVCLFILGVMNIKK